MTDKNELSCWTNISTKGLDELPCETNSGFLLSIEGLVAIAIFVLVLLIISNQIFQPVIPRGVYLKHVSFDVLKVLAKDGRMTSALGSNSSAVREILEALPRNICMQLNLENAANSTNITIAKPGCTGFGNQIQTSYGTVLYNNKQYIAKLESWFSS